MRCFKKLDHELTQSALSSLLLPPIPHCGADKTMASLLLRSFWFVRQLLLVTALLLCHGNLRAAEISITQASLEALDDG